MKKVHISEQLFIALVKYHLGDIESELPEIKQGLMEKLDAMILSELYSKYKTAPTKEEKEDARLQYLEKRGVSESFRW